jgi:hypothetical protein
LVCVSLSNPKHPKTKGGAPQGFPLFVLEWFTTAFATADEDGLSQEFDPFAQTHLGTRILSRAKRRKSALLLAQLATVPKLLFANPLR